MKMPHTHPHHLCDNVFIPEELLTHDYRYVAIIPATRTAEDTISWLARQGLLWNAVACPTCHNPASLNKYAKGIDGVQWCCNTDGFTQSIHAGSFFERSHPSLSKIVIIMYSWSRDDLQKDIGWESQADLGNTLKPTQRSLVA